MSAGAFAAGGAVFGAVTSYMAIKEQNKAIVAQAEFNIQKFKMDESLANYAQSNNTLRANEISTQLAAEAQEAGRDVTVAEREALGTETIRRGEGLTAGSSVVRSVDDVIAKGNKAKAQVTAQEEKAFMAVQGQAREANAAQQMSKINSYNNMITQNAQLAMQQVSGVNALLQIGGQSLQGASSGANLGSAMSSN